MSERSSSGPSSRSKPAPERPKARVLSRRIATHVQLVGFEEAEHHRATGLHTESRKRARHHRRRGDRRRAWPGPRSMRPACASSRAAVSSESVAVGEVVPRRTARRSDPWCPRGRPHERHRGPARVVLHGDRVRRQGPVALRLVDAEPPHHRVDELLQLAAIVHGDDAAARPLRIARLARPGRGRKSESTRIQSLVVKPSNLTSDASTRKA